MLIKNNADVGSQIAVSLSELRNGRKKRTTSKGHSFCDGSKKQDKSRPVSNAAVMTLLVHHM